VTCLTSTPIQFDREQIIIEETKLSPGRAILCSTGWSAAGTPGMQPRITYEPCKGDTANTLSRKCATLTGFKSFLRDPHGVPLRSTPCYILPPFQGLHPCTIGIANAGTQQIANLCYNMSSSILHPPHTFAVCTIGTNVLYESLYYHLPDGLIYHQDDGKTVHNRDECATPHQTLAADFSGTLSGYSRA
jgi:hypothetical protein